MNKRRKRIPLWRRNKSTKRWYERWQAFLKEIGYVPGVGPKSEG